MPPGVQALVLDAPSKNAYSLKSIQNVTKGTSGVSGGIVAPGTSVWNYIIKLVEQEGPSIYPTSISPLSRLIINGKLLGARSHC